MSKRMLLSEVRLVSATRPAGYLEDVLAHGTVDGDIVTIGDDDYAKLVAKYRAAPAPPGPGTELKALLKKVGITASPGCSCNARARVMDTMEAKEPGWCEKNLETICDWLQEEATKRKLPFVRMAAKILVRQAIRNARKKGQ